jgi:hypothetical protein
VRDGEGEIVFGSPSPSPTGNREREVGGEGERGRERDAEGERVCSGGEESIDPPAASCDCSPSASRRFAALKEGTSRSGRRSNDAAEEAATSSWTSSFAGSKLLLPEVFVDV